MHFSSHFPIEFPWGSINLNKMDIKDNQNLHLVGENASQAAETPKTSRTSPSGQREDQKKYSAE